MKHLFVVIALFFSTFIWAQNACNTYFPLNKNSERTYITYNAKNNPEGKMLYKITEFNELKDGYTANINISFEDKKGNNAYEKTTEVSCKDGIFSMDFQSMIPAGIQDQLDDNIEMSFENQKIDFPANPQVGDKLPDVSYNFNMKSGGANVMNMEITITEREIVARETITTAAGEFDCIKYKAVSKYNINAMGMTMPGQSGTDYTWFSGKVGMVKSESYNRNGKLESSTLLESFKN
ncbi:MAG: hypothetical protein R2798_03310 [Chitinophagales bacterium]|nr:hypothetical protein [Bacteroidota bacterium]